MGNIHVEMSVESMKVNQTASKKEKEEKVKDIIRGNFYF